MSAVHEPESVDDAVRLLESLGARGAVLAGGTWVMRAGLRGETPREAYVSLRRIGPLRTARREAGQMVLGALLSHVEIAALEPYGGLRGLADAARRSAFPAVRNVATLGGNLAAPFPEADLVPPLLAGQAVVEVALPDGVQTVDVETWLRAPRRPEALITAVRMPLAARRRAAFERLTVRGGAEYAIASVAVSADLAEDGTVAAARVAVGAVEEVPRRVAAAETALSGRAPDRAAGDEAGRAAARELIGRDGLDAPGWYRTEVLPELLGRCVARLAEETEATDDV